MTIFRIGVTFLVSLVAIANCAGFYKEPVTEGFTRQEAEKVIIENITVKLRQIKKDSKSWTFEFTVLNASDKNVFIMVSPTRSNGEQSPYITLDENDSSTLILSSRLYMPPYYFNLAKDSARVYLRMLEPSRTYTEGFTLNLPLEQSMPPYGFRPERKAIPLDTIKKVKLAIGVLPDDEGVKDIIKRKLLGPFTKGIEIVQLGSFKGKYLIEVQTVVASNTINILQ